MHKQDDLLDYRILPPLRGFCVWWISDAELIGPDPIIGWAVARNRTRADKGYFWSVDPITPEMVATAEDQAHVIECPDGQIIIPEDRTLKNLEEAKKYIRSQFEEAEKRKAERAAARSK